MAEKWPLADGSWSNAANWNGGTKPLAGDDVFADNRTIIIDENVTVLSLRTTQRSGGTAGGNFTLNSGLTVSANLIPGSTAVISRNSGAGESTIIGTLVGGTSLSNVRALIHTTNNTTNITGSITGGLGGSSNPGVYMSTGILNVVGNITGGDSNLSDGIQCDGGTINAIGNVTGSSVTNATGIAIRGSNIAVSIVGSLIPGTQAPAISPSAAGQQSSIVNHTGNIIASSQAMNPFAWWRYRIHSSSTLTHTYRTNNAGAVGPERSLFTGGQNLGQPVASNVRAGTTFGVSNEFTGTLAVPNPQYVSAGVLTDNTVGTLQHLTVAQLNAALQPNAPIAVERSIDDTKAITFSWPVSGATITAEKSIDNGNYSAVTGAITFLRTELGRHYYTLAYNADDRVVEEATVRYKLVDGTYTKFINLRVVASSVDVEEIVNSVWDEPMDQHSTAGSFGSGFVTLLGRITSTVYQTFQDLAQMITGSGTVNAKWTGKALENGPSGTISIPASIAEGIVDGGTLVLYRGTTFSYQLTNIGDLTGWTKIYFTARREQNSVDSESLIQIAVSNPSSGSDGLIRLNQQSSTANLGSITIQDVATGDITLRLEADATRQLQSVKEIPWDVKVIKSSGIPPLVLGKLNVELDVTRAIT